ncbi:hypothetical protein [Streptomyces sp. bgisy126]|uniref:hypothetical protein n=1 Tax=unclassified Streptomyces TaxID=2593676 RepID=UPI003EBF42AC
MRQDHVESSPIRNLTCPAENGSIDSLTSTAIQHPKKRLIDGSSGENTSKMPKHGAHRSIQTLERDIRDWLDNGNGTPRPSARTKTARDILGKAAAHCRRIPDSDHQAVSFGSPHTLPAVGGWMASCDPSIA